MSCEISISSDRTHVLMTVQGEINRELAYKYNIEAHTIGRKAGINRYLVDLTDAHNTDSVIDKFDFAYTDMRSDPVINPNARVVVLVAVGDHSHDFVETVARNAGMNVTMFTDREQAIKFLYSD